MLQREKIVKNNKYLDTNKMVWLVVGDAKTQLETLTKLVFCDPGVTKSGNALPIPIGID